MEIQKIIGVMWVRMYVEQPIASFFFGGTFSAANIVGREQEKHKS